MVSFNDFSAIIGKVAESATAQFQSLKKTVGEMSNMSVTSRYAQVSFLVDFVPTVGQFEYFVWPSDYSLTFSGWNPVIKVDGLFTMVIGLPSKLQVNIFVTSFYKGEKIKDTLLLANSQPDWKVVIEDLTSLQKTDVYSID